MNIFKNVRAVMAALTLLILALLGACQTPDRDKNTELSNEELIRRGAYLVDVGACNECHSPKVMTPKGPVPDKSRLLSGHPKDEKLPPVENTNNWVLFSLGATTFIGPWGQSFSANLTPHDTGIGSWSFDQFKKAIRHGKYKGLDGSRELLPPMPWQLYKNITSEDLLALFTYLKSLTPIDNLVPSHIAPEDIVRNQQ